jgi:hypothetical protein
VHLNENIPGVLEIAYKDFHVPVCYESWSSSFDAYVWTGIFYKFRPQIVSVGTTANSTLIIKECPEEILLKLAIVLKISKSI